MESPSKKETSFSKDIQKDISHNLQEKVLEKTGNDLNTIRRSEIRAEKLYRESLEAVFQEELKDLSKKGEKVLEKAAKVLSKLEAEQTNQSFVEKKADLKKLQCYDRAGARSGQLLYDRSICIKQFTKRSYQSFENTFSPQKRPNCTEHIPVPVQSTSEHVGEHVRGEEKCPIPDKMGLSKYGLEDNDILRILRNADNLQNCSSNMVLLWNNNNMLNGLLNEELMQIMNQQSFQKDEDGLNEIHIALEDKLLTEHFAHKLQLKGAAVQLVASICASPSAATISKSEKARRIKEARRRMRKRAEERRLAFGEISSDETDGQ